VPTVLRFRGYDVMLFADDHPPARVHVRGNGVEMIYRLNCSERLVGSRERVGAVSPIEQRAVEDFLTDHAGILCERWAAIDDQR